MSNQLYGADLQQTSPSGGHIGVHSAPTLTDVERIMSDGCMRVNECAIDLATGNQYVLDVIGAYNFVTLQITTPPQYTQITSKTQISANIATLQTQVTQNAADIVTNTTNIAGNTTNITQNAADIVTNTTNIAGNTTNITQNAADIVTNTTNIAGNTTAITANTTNITQNTTDIAANTTAITTNTAGVATNAACCATNTAAIAALTDVDNFDDLTDMDTTATVGTAGHVRIESDGASGYVTSIDPIPQYCLLDEELPIAPAMGDITLHFAATGDDDTGDGTAGAPFATPQGAVLSLERRHFQTCEKLFGSILIESVDAGAATYEAPCMIDIPCEPEGCIITFSGTRQNVIATSTAATLTPVADSAAQFDIPSGVVLVTETPADGTSHWSEDTGLTAFFTDPQYYGGLTRTGAPLANTRVTLPTFGAFAFGTVNFYEFQTTFNLYAQNATQLQRGATGTRVANLLIRWAGIDSEIDPATGTDAVFYNVEMVGSKVRGDAMFVSDNAYDKTHTVDVTATSAFATRGENFNTVNGSILRSTSILNAAEITYQGTVFEGNTDAIRAERSRVNFANRGNDFYNNTGVLIRAVDRVSLRFFGNGNSQQLFGTVGTLFDVVNLSYVNTSDTHDFAVSPGGAITGYIAELELGSYAFRLNGFPSLVGVAGTADILFVKSGLTTSIGTPANDFAAANSQGVHYTE